MKRGGCCNACRRRHRKCVVQLGASQCGACAESGRECRFDTDIRFRHSSHARESVETRRSWARVPATISFVTPQGIDGELSEAASEGKGASSSGKSPRGGDSFYSETESGAPSMGREDSVGNETGMQDSGPDQHPADQGSDINPHAIASPGHAENADFVDSQQAGLHLDNEGDIIPVFEASPSSNAHLLPLSPASGHRISSIPYILGEPSSELPPPQTPSSKHISGGDAEHDSRTQSTHHEDTYGFTERQAFLFMTYVHKLAPSSDACDDARHFTLEVPRLAFQEPMIMNGVLALASRYDARCNNTNSDLESTYYHSRCIELLIEAFARPPETWDSKLLTTVVIARLYEEYDNEADSYYHHLSGTRNLLNHEAVARFVTQGGLAEAASWVHLRQAIYIYLVRREPVEICLENFERSTVFRRGDDSAYANRAVYIFAKMMKLLFPLDAAGAAQEGTPGPWEMIEMEVKRWYEMKPHSFRPIYYKAADVQNDRPFPMICIAASVPVVAMQHYYAAKAVICLRKCNNMNPNIGYHAAKLRYDWEVSI
ncbi:hypothetical protein ACJZ2D_011797 [Fusarium nematophilum]